MKEITFNNDEALSKSVIVVTTNGIIKPNGSLVMGKGIALEVKNKFPKVDGHLGFLVKEYGNIPHLLCYKVAESELFVISFPTKQHWKDHSDLNLIENSCKLFVDICNTANFKDVYLPRPGCSNGGLSWTKDVKPVISKILDDNFTVYKRAGDKE